jgi:hypothetical protein
MITSFTRQLAGAMARAARDRILLLLIVGLWAVALSLFLTGCAGAAPTQAQPVALSTGTNGVALQQMDAGAQAVSVTVGGTGVQSPAAHTLAIGEGASPFNFTGVGTACLFYQSATTADPTCALTFAGSYFFTGNVSYGGSTTSPSSILYVSPNTTAPPAPVTGTILQVSDVTSSGNAMTEFDGGNGAVPTLFFNAFNGTVASPTTLTTQFIADLSFNGFDGTNKLVNAGGFLANSCGTWTTTNHCAQLTLQAVPSGSTTALTLEQVDGITSSVALGGATGSETLRVDHTANAVDRLECVGSAAASPATLGCLAAGTDTNISIIWVPKGNGANLFSSHLGTSEGSPNVPTISACGTSPTTTGVTDIRGVITEGTGATSCTVTFGTAYQSTPVCMLTAFAAATVPFVSSVSASVLVIGEAVAGKIEYFCFQ